MTRAAVLDGADETVLAAFGAALARELVPGLVVYLRGELGAGKTTLARAIVQALLPQARVKSPTYTLIESYPTPAFPIHHLDLYRIAAPDELALIGVRDLAADGAVLLVEWPERGARHLPAPDLDFELEHAGETRNVRVVAASDAGSAVLARVGPGAG